MLFTFEIGCDYLMYTFDELKNELSEYGFNLNQFVSTKELISTDKNGYKYKLNLCNLKNGKKPNLFMHNPFAIDNLRLYLQLKKNNTICKVFHYVYQCLAFLVFY